MPQATRPRVKPVLKCEIDSGSICYMEYDPRRSELADVNLARRLKRVHTSVNAARISACATTSWHNYLQRDLLYANAG
jgi:hypothetical protein